MKEVFILKKKYSYVYKLENVKSFIEFSVLSDQRLCCKLHVELYGNKLAHSWSTLDDGSISSIWPLVEYASVLWSSTYTR